MLNILEQVARSSSIATIISIAAVSIAILIAASYLYLNKSRTSQSSVSTKGQQAKAMKATFENAETRNDLVENPKSSLATMEISQIWVYPIKSMRGCRLSSATLTKYGFAHDRNFMLLKVLEETPQKLQNMHITKFPEMCLFHTSVQDNKLLVEYRPPGNSVATTKLEVPLEYPSLEKLARVDVDMHGSPNRGYDMGKRYNEWFSELFGFKVVFAYWGGDARPVLGNLVPNKARVERPKPKTLISTIASHIPIISKQFNYDDGGIAFNDCAPYLVITEKSAEDVTARLPEGVDVDITKFRANIVLKGSSAAFEEDFWAELLIADARIILTGNCGRCVSLNIDHETGKSGTGKDGQMLKLLSTDRRVDPGMKYSPIFGRYGFASRRSEGRALNVGDKVVVSRKNQERTRFYWPGVST